MSEIDLYDMDKGLELSAVVRELLGGSSHALFPVSATVLVQGSSGGETQATVIGYNPNKALYTVVFDDGRTKSCHEESMRLARRWDEEDGDMIDITSV